MLIEVASARIVEEQHSRVPVYETALRPRTHHRPRLLQGHLPPHALSRPAHSFGGAVQLGLRLRQVMRDVFVVPETKPVLDLLQEFQQRRRHLAIVVDEFGTTVGLVTVEDAIEQIIGEVEDEFDIAEKLLRSTLRGFMPRRQRQPSATSAPNSAGPSPRGRRRNPRGFLLARLGHLPDPGESVTHGDRRYLLEEMAGRRIARVRVETIPHAQTRTR